jgi:endonuclease III
MMATTGKNKALTILKMLREKYTPECALQSTTPEELIIATVLSAQCTDKKVNEVTPVLFKAYPDMKALGSARLEDVEAIIKPTGFYHQKAKSIMGLARILVERFHGKVPSNMDMLLTLPGVGRKTANIVLGDGFGIVSGIAVDTHVKRLSMRLGLTENTDPDKIEQDLMRQIKKDDWTDFSHLLIQHGRAVCDAKKPHCDACFLSVICPKIGIDK